MWSASVTAQSATGTCQGPTIGSRWLKPPTLRSPIVIRKRLLATVGCRSTVNASSSNLSPVSASAGSLRTTRDTSRCVLGGLPSNTAIGIAITGSPPGPSSTIRSGASVVTPTTAKGQRSRRHSCSNSAMPSGAIASV